MTAASVPGGTPSSRVFTRNPGRFKNATAIVDALRQPDPPATSIDRGHFERRRRQLALDTAAGRIEERHVLTAMRRMKEVEGG